MLPLHTKKQLMGRSKGQEPEVTTANLQTKPLLDFCEPATRKSLGQFLHLESTTNYHLCSTLFKTSSEKYYSSPQTKNKSVPSQISKRI